MRFIPLYQKLKWYGVANAENTLGGLVKFTIRLAELALVIGAEYAKPSKNKAVRGIKLGRGYMYRLGLVEVVRV